MYTFVLVLPYPFSAIACCYARKIEGKQTKT